MESKKNGANLDFVNTATNRRLAQLLVFLEIEPMNSRRKFYLNRK